MTTINLYLTGTLYKVSFDEEGHVKVRGRFVKPRYDSTMKALVFSNKTTSIETTDTKFTYKVDEDRLEDSLPMASVIINEGGKFPSLQINLQSGANLELHNVETDVVTIYGGFNTSIKLTGERFDTESLHVTIGAAAMFRVLTRNAATKKLDLNIGQRSRVDTIDVFESASLNCSRGSHVSIRKLSDKLKLSMGTVDNTTLEILEPQKAISRQSNDDDDSGSEVPQSKKLKRK